MWPTVRAEEGGGVSDVMSLIEEGSAAVDSPAEAGWFDRFDERRGEAAAVVKNRLADGDVAALARAGAFAEGGEPTRLGRSGHLGRANGAVSWRLAALAASVGVQ
jgi:hypothetical protein